MKYINVFGIIAFTHEGKDYISDKGDTVNLPKCDYVSKLVKKGFIQLAVISKQLSVKNTKNKLIKNE